MKLAVEIDGATHISKEEIERDKEKEKYIKNVGVEIKRYLNKDIYKNQDLVIDNILEVCRRLKKW